MSRLICVSSVPSHHRVTAYGAAGGRSVLAMSRSHGVCITGDFLLRRGELLYILVGQQGEDACPNVSIILLIQFLHLFLNGCKIQFKSWTYIFHFYKLSYILLSQKNMVYIYIYIHRYIFCVAMNKRKKKGRMKKIVLSVSAGWRGVYLSVFDWQQLAALPECWWETTGAAAYVSCADSCCGRRAFSALAGFSLSEMTCKFLSGSFSVIRASWII